MSEKISIGDAIARTFLGHCLISALAAKRTEDIVPAGSKELDVHLTINGHEVKISHFMKSLEEQHERMLTERAQELMKERFGKFNDVLHNLESNVKEEFYKAFPDANEDVW